MGVCQDDFVDQLILKQQQEQEKKANMLFIYAELNHKQLKEIEGNNNFLSSLPNGVEIIRKQGKRACFFECDDLNTKEELVDILDQHRINWQEN